MSKLSEITEQQLLKNNNVRHILHDEKYYFSTNDLNLEYIGAFKNVRGKKLPFLDKKTHLTFEISCIPYSKIEEVAQSLKDIPEFNQAINVLFGFKPKK